MNSLEKMYLERSLFYKNLYKKCEWWEFSKKIEMKKRWIEAREKMIKYS